jgi:hypothetical protein
MKSIAFAAALIALVAAVPAAEPQAKSAACSDHEILVGKLYCLMTIANTNVCMLLSSRHF